MTPLSHLGHATERIAPFVQAAETAGAIIRSACPLYAEAAKSAGLW